MADNYLDGSPSWRAYLADLERRAAEPRARPNRDPFEGWHPPSDHEVTVAEPPQVVSEKPDTQLDGATLVKYDDGSVWRISREFSPFTERDEQVYERVRDVEELDLGPMSGTGNHSSAE